MSIVTTVVRAMERIAPLHLAEKWDNVSLPRSIPSDYIYYPWGTYTGRPPC